MRQVLRTAAAILVIAGAEATLPALAADTWDVVPEEKKAPAAFIRIPGEQDWPETDVQRVDDGQRLATFPKAAPPPPEDIKLVVTCAERQTVAILVTGVAYAEPRLIGGLRFDVDGREMTRVAALEYSERDGAWFPKTEVTRDDRLVEALRKGSNAKAAVVGNAADGRVVEVPLAGSHAAIDRTLENCDAARNADA